MTDMSYEQMLVSINNDGGEERGSWDCSFNTGLFRFQNIILSLNEA